MVAQKKVFGTLQVGRGLAAFLIVLYHSAGILTLSKYWNYQGFNPLFFANSGVEYFFVLSGIVILHAHWDDVGKPSALKTYFWKRFRRIYPIYWIVLFGLLAICFVFPTLGDATVRKPGPILESIVLIPIIQRGTILPIAWSLFHEVVFYLVFAVAIANKRIGAVALAVWFAGSVVSCFYTPTSSVLAMYFSPLHLMFALGFLAAYLVRERSLPGWPLVALGIGGFIACGVYVDVRMPAGVFWPLYFGLFSAIAAAGLMSVELRHTMKVPKFLLFLGNASYSLYLVHYAILSAMAKLLFRVKFFSTARLFVPFTVLVVISTAAGLLVHVYIEQPLLKRIPK